MSDEKPNEVPNKWENVAAAAEQAEQTEETSAEQIPYEELMAKVSALEAKDQENKDKVLRCHAEMDNLRRRVKLDMEQAHKDALKRFAGELLPVIDNLERSLEQKEEDGTDGSAGGGFAVLRTGVELTLKLFQDTLQKFAIKPINPLDQPFDPHLHEAMSMQEHAEKAPGTVLMVLQKGYLLHDRLLRPAMVVVAKAVGQG
jgi:molecular chaperone GrpE